MSPESLVLDFVRVSVIDCNVCQHHQGRPLSGDENESEEPGYGGWIGMESCVMVKVEMMAGFERITQPNCEN
jgi:hypothetical protein